MPYRIVRNNIALMECDAIVNTANEFVAVGPGCDEAIYQAAGYEKLLAYRKERIGEVPEGNVFVTPGFDLKASIIIHAVSPLVDPDEEGEKVLRNTYKRVFAMASGLGVKELALPLISTGSFGFPKEIGLRIAIDEVQEFLKERNMDIAIVIFDSTSTMLAREYTDDIREYIDDRYVEIISQTPSYNSYSNHEFASQMARPVETESKRKSFFDRFKGKNRAAKESETLESNVPDSFNLVVCEEEPFGYGEVDTCYADHTSLIDERLKHMKDSFSDYLLYLISQKGMTNAEVYNRAIVNKKVFSKIKNNSDYHPNKMTAMCLCVGAMLNIDEAKDLLARAGYALSPSSKTDIIFSYFIENKIYDMIELDIVLEEFGLPCLIQ